MRKLLRSSWLLILALLVVIGATSALAGVTVELVNKTGATLHDVVILYDGKVVDAADIAHDGELSRRLGKIGEGSLITIRMRQHGQCREAAFEIYFQGLSPFVLLTFEIMPDGRVQLLQNHKLDVVRPRETCVSPAQGNTVQL